MIHSGNHEAGIHRLRGDFMSGLTKTYLLFNLVMITLGGALLYALEFPAIKSVFGFVMITLALYLVLEYLTLLPHAIVLLITFFQFKIPKQILFPFVFVSVIASFFILFAI